MAEGKKSFIAYLDWHTTFDALSVKESGQLIRMIFDYVCDKDPKPPSRLVAVAFEGIKQDLKRDLKKWDKYIEKQRVNGHKGGRPKEPTETQITQAFIEKPKKADSVNVNVNVNDNVNDNVNERGKGKKFTPPTKEDVFNEMILKIGEFTAHGESEKFLDFYESKGWFIGKNKMKDWKSAVRNWIRGMQKFNQNGSAINSTKLGTSAARIEAARNF